MTRGFIYLNFQDNAGSDIVTLVVRALWGGLGTLPLLNSRRLQLAQR